MNKFVLNTLDKVKEYPFTKARVYTDTYDVKLNKNEIHTPNAAKVIIEGDGIISAFIVIQPLINVNSNGDISLHTPSSFKQATLEEKYKDSSHDIKDVKRDLKILEAKFKLGISVEELIELNLSKATLEAMVLEDRKENIYKGGGF